MRIRNRARVFSGVLAAVAVGASACGDDLGPIACTDVFVYGLSVDVFDAATNEPKADSATLTITEGGYTEITEESFDGLTMVAAGERAGTYAVVVSRPGYQNWVTTNVTITEDECHVIPVRLLAALQAVP